MSSTTKIARIGLRYSSTQVAKSTMAKLSACVADAGNRLVFWGRVGKELAKEVYVKENLAPPKLNDWVAAKREFFDEFNLHRIREWRLQELARKTLLGAELIGFFAIGEVIGRMNLIGYSI